MTKFDAMNAVELRSELFRLIDRIEDVDILNSVRTLLAPCVEEDEVDDFWDDLPEERKENKGEV